MNDKSSLVNAKNSQKEEIKQKNIPTFSQVKQRNRLFNYIFFIEISGICICLAMCFVYLLKTFLS